MNDPLVILGIAGSIRQGSFNRLALQAAQGLAPEGTTVETFDIKGLPGFSQDDEANPPDQVVDLGTIGRGKRRHSEPLSHNGRDPLWSSDHSRSSSMSAFSFARLRR